MYKVIQFLSQGEFPSPNKLTELKKQGIFHLLNLSGIDLFKLYTAEQLADFTIVQFTFKDIFSTGTVVKPEQIASIDADVYCQQSSEAERLAFFNAVLQLIDWLKHQTSSYVFCQQGIGRSPAVICSALAYFYHPPSEQILKTIKFLNQEAVLTTISYAAAKWFEIQTNQIR